MRAVCRPGHRGRAGGAAASRGCPGRAHALCGVRAQRHHSPSRFERPYPAPGPRHGARRRLASPASSAVASSRPAGGSGTCPPGSCTAATLKVKAASVFDTVAASTEMRRLVKAMSSEAKPAPPVGAEREAEVVGRRGLVDVAGDPLERRARPVGKAPVTGEAAVDRGQHQFVGSLARGATSRSPAVARAQDHHSLRARSRDACRHRVSDGDELFRLPACRQWRLRTSRGLLGQGAGTAAPLLRPRRTACASCESSSRQSRGSAAERAAAMPLRRRYGCVTRERCNVFGLEPAATRHVASPRPFPSSTQGALSRGA